MKSIYTRWNEDQSRTKAEAFHALSAYCLPSGNVMADLKQGRDDITFSVLAVLNLQYDITFSVIPGLTRDLPPRSMKQEMADQVRHDRKGVRDSRKPARHAVLISGNSGNMYNLKSYNYELTNSIFPRQTTNAKPSPTMNIVCHAKRSEASQETTLKLKLKTECK